jgi:acetyl esterase
LKWYWEQYLPDRDARQDPRAVPPRAESLAGLPPAIVVTAEYDPLHDEGVAYAERLSSEGVPVNHFDFGGQIHGFMALVGLVPGVERQLNLVADSIAEAVHAHQVLMA